MTQEQINEGNFLISVFNGWLYSDIKEFVADPSHKYLHNYHEDWNWLMPVVEKIESIKDSDDYEVDIFGRCCDIGGKIETVAKNKIEATWIAVVKFIAKANGKEWILD